MVLCNNIPWYKKGAKEKIGGKAVIVESQGVEMEATSGMDADTLQLIVERQTKTIEALELKMKRTSDSYLQMRQKHLDINTQLVQANVSYQNQLTEANRLIRTLRNEKEELLRDLAEQKGANSTLIAALAASQAVASTYQDDFHQQLASFMSTKTNSVQPIESSPFLPSPPTFESEFQPPSLPARVRELSVDLSSLDSSGDPSEELLSDEEKENQPFLMLSPISSPSCGEKSPEQIPSPQPCYPSPPRPESSARRRRRQNLPNYAEPSLRKKLRRT